MRIWLDDLRPMPKDFDIHFKRGEQLIEYIRGGNKIDFISFDHDLSFKHYYGIQNGKLTGYDVARLIEELAYYNKINRFGWKVHSANPVGAKRIKQAMLNADKYWYEHEKRSRPIND
jgi:hypothetical protein